MAVPINVVIFGLTGRDTAEIVRAMRQSDAFNVVEWFGIVEDATRNTFDFYQFQTDYNAGLNVPEELFRQLHKELFYFVDNEVRRSEAKDCWRAVNIRSTSVYEQLDKFHRYVYLAWELFTTRPVDLFLIDSIPHCSGDLILYKVAKYLGIPTLMIYPSPFPNKFFYFTEFNDNAIDFEIYNTEARPIKGVIQHFPLEKREKLYYMANLRTQPVPFDLKNLWSDLRWNMAMRSADTHPTGYDFKWLWLDLRTGFKKILRQRRWDALEGRLQLLVKFAEYRRFYRNLQSLIDPDFDWNVPYVYFPLHFQPELTTMCQGNQIYVNQALALEQLARLVPKDWFIYVKEHPLQYEICRDDSFFQRLRAIPNLKMVPTETSTFDLIEHSRFVSTISGTVGWEAIKNGKNVLLFGNMYYQFLPGVFRYRDGFILDELLNYRIDEEALQQAVNVLYSRLETGVVNADSSAMVPDYNGADNARQVMAFIQWFMQGQSTPARTPIEAGAPG